MNRIAIVLTLAGTACAVEQAPNALGAEERAAGFVLLFDGASLAGWRTAHPEKYRVEEGCLVADGTKGRSMLYHVGADGEARFRDFELRMQVRTDPKANSGIYFRTEEQPQGRFPEKQGYEAQIATTHGNPHATGSLYHVVRVAKPPVRDEVWFDYTVTVNGRRIVLALDGATVVDYTEPEDKPTRLTGDRIGLQCHEPGIVRFRSIRIRPLAATAPPAETAK